MGEEDEEYEDGGVGDPEINGNAGSSTLRPPAVRSLRLSRVRRSGDVQVMVGFPPSVVRTEVNL